MAGFSVIGLVGRMGMLRLSHIADSMYFDQLDTVAKVEAGSSLVNAAGQSMQDIVTQVKRVTEMIAEISSASVEQTRGISQVGEAVTHLDQATQQNAALVEESAAAAQSLRQQATRLTDVVGVFTLPEPEAEAATA